MPGLAEIWAALPEARIVGGAVRDYLAQRRLADIDMATALTPDLVTQRLRTYGIKSIPTGIAHGTITAVMGRHNFEITTLRRDITTDGRHAQIAFTDDWQADAARRDFTINAMSMNRDGEIFDYFGGRADLAAGIIRFVGQPGARIAEDYLRILRFFRFLARYGKTAPEAAAISAITAACARLSGLSAERIWSEMQMILAADHPFTAVQLMDECGVLTAAIPEGFDIARLGRLLADRAPADPLLRLAALLDGSAAAFAARLKLGNQQAETLQAIRTPSRLLPADDDAGLRRALADTAPPILIARVWLAQAQLVQPKADWAQLRARLEAIPRPVFPLAGRDLAAVGMAEGPEIGRILSSVRNWWLANGCMADHEACLNYAGGFI